GAAGTAMAITHRFRRAADLDLYSATEAATGMIHGCSPRPSCSPRLAPGNKHRDALFILPVLVSEHSDQITLLQPDADEDVGRGHCGEQHVADGHDRGGPKRDDEAEIDRMTHELVEQRRAEARFRHLLVDEMTGDLRQA